MLPYVVLSMSLGRGPSLVWLLAWSSKSLLSILIHSGEEGCGTGLACSRGRGKVVGETGSTLQTWEARCKQAFSPCKCLCLKCCGVLL